MNRYCLISLFCFLFVTTNILFGQNFNTEKRIINPIAFGDVSFKSDSSIIKKYDPFEDYTFYTSTFGTRVYESDNDEINIFPFLLFSGKGKGIKTDTSFRLLVISNPNSSEIQLADSEIIFLIDEDRHKLEIGKSNFIVFSDFTLYKKLYEASSVRARIKTPNDRYEINIGKNQRDLIQSFTEKIKSYD